jgi:hypothetical protein
MPQQTWPLGHCELLVHSSAIPIMLVQSPALVVHASFCAPPPPGPLKVTQQICPGCVHVALPHEMVPDAAEPSGPAALESIPEAGPPSAALASGVLGALDPESIGGGADESFDGGAASFAPLPAS